MATKHCRSVATDRNKTCQSPDLCHNHSWTTKRNSNNSNHPMETKYTKNSFIITPIKGKKKCDYPPSMGWVLGYPQTPSTCVESLSSIMCKPNKNMVFNNETNHSYNSECNNENNQKWIMNGKPFYL